MRTLKCISTRRARQCRLSPHHICILAHAARWRGDIALVSGASIGLLEVAAICDCESHTHTHTHTHLQDRAAWSLAAARDTTPHCCPVSLLTPTFARTFGIVKLLRKGRRGARGTAMPGERGGRDVATRDSGGRHRSAPPRHRICRATPAAAQPQAARRRASQGVVPAGRSARAGAAEPRTPSSVRAVARPPGTWRVPHRIWNRPRTVFFVEKKPVSS